MDAATIQKIPAMNRYRNHQLLNNLIFYTVTALICSLLCSGPFWLPSLSSSMRVSLFVSLPKLGSLLFSSMSVVLIGSLIIIFLVGESKALTSGSSPASEVYYDEYVRVSRSLWSLSGHEKKKEMKEVKCFEEKVERYELDGEGGKWKKWEMEKKPKVKLGGEENLSLPELNKRADDFIARVNRQRKLEASY